MTTTYWTFILDYKLYSVIIRQFSQHKYEAECMEYSVKAIGNSIQEAKDTIKEQVYLYINQGTLIHG